MRDRKSNNGAPLFSWMHIVLLLLCAVMISTYAIGGLYARYTSKNTGSSSARVIYFGNITIDEPANKTVILTPGVTASKETKVTFEGSEASTFVFVIITASNHFKRDGNTLKILNNNSTTVGTLVVANDWNYVTQDGDQFVFCKALDPNVELSQNQVFATQNGVAGGVAVPNTVTASDLSFLSSNITLSVKAIAMQSAGFANAADAWLSASK